MPFLFAHPGTSTPSRNRETKPFLDEIELPFHHELKVSPLDKPFLDRLARVHGIRLTTSRRAAYREDLKWSSPSHRVSRDYIWNGLMVRGDCQILSSLTRPCSSSCQHHLRQMTSDAS